EPGQRGDAVFGNAARDDAAEMVEVGVDVERHPVIADPMAHPDADRRDLVLAPVLWAVTAGDPDADPAVAPLAPDIEARQGTDHPFLEPPDMAAHVAVAPAQIEHHIGDPLPGPVIGVLPAAAAAKHRQPPRI